MSRKHRRAVAWMLVVVMSLSPSLVYAQTFESAAARRPKAEDRPELRHAGQCSRGGRLSSPRADRAGNGDAAGGSAFGGRDAEGWHRPAPNRPDSRRGRAAKGRGDWRRGRGEDGLSAGAREASAVAAAVYRRRPIGRQAVPPRGQSDDARRFPRRQPHGAGGNGRNGSQIGRQPCRPEGRSHEPHVGAGGRAAGRAGDFAHRAAPAVDRHAAGRWRPCRRRLPT